MRSAVRLSTRPSSMHAVGKCCRSIQGFVAITRNGSSIASLRPPATTTAARRPCRTGAYLCEVAVVIYGPQVVEQLQCTHERLRSRRVHEVKVDLQEGAGQEQRCEEWVQPGVAWCDLRAGGVQMCNTHRKPGSPGSW
eukprot:GHRQ01034319.1.p2 GENE.GHRQ01034319.1~~GHRQ01034319.1.p2  ORF type:complete len:138 (+),score=8.45 GHRQ01034319.1:299-712(+)